MNFKKLQAMQAELDEAILKEKAPMTPEERFNKDLVGLSAEISEIANCSGHFKYWKNNKGEVDTNRFVIYDRESDISARIGYRLDRENNLKEIKTEVAHKQTLVEECSDALHFILSLANQMEYGIDGWSSSTKELEEAYLDLQWSIVVLKSSSSYGIVDQMKWQLINDFMTYVGNLGVTTKDLEQAYYDKNKINYERLENGY